MRATHRSRGTRNAQTTLFVSALVSLLVVGATGASTLTAAAQTAPGTSGQGIVPVVLNGGNQTCADVPSAATFNSSERLEVQSNSLAGTLPAGLEVTLASGKRSISWTSTFPIAAVIVKGGDEANVYRYIPGLLSDTGLVAPPRPNGQPAEVSNVTLCWVPGGEDDGVDLQALCLTEAAKAEVGDIVSFAGPIVIEDGMVDMSTVPAGFLITYDAMTEMVGFTAPWPVVIAITAASAPVVHLIDPPSTTGSVPLASNPGDGELVLCGLDTSVVVALTCAQTGADAELGPVEIRGATYDPADLPEGITSLDLSASIGFASTVPVVGIIVEASPPVLYAFATPVLTGSIPVTVLPDDEIDLVFCVRTASSPGPEPVTPGTETAATVTPTTPAPEPLLGATASDPTLIATGGGPAPRVPAALVLFVILALTGTSTMLLWSRGG